MNPVDGDGPSDDPALPDALLGSIDSLMARHRGAAGAGAVAPPVVAPAPALRAPTDPSGPSVTDATIPVLTDVVGADTSGPARVATALSADEVARVEDLVYRRMRARLDREVAVLLEERLLPEFTRRVEGALAQVSGELKGTLREMIRGAIEEALAAQIHNRPLPLADAAPSGSSAVASTGRPGG
jgi:hypothetical protein